MVRTSFPEIGAEHMLQSPTAGCGRKRQLTGVGSKTAIAAKQTVGYVWLMTEKGRTATFDDKTARVQT